MSVAHLAHFRTAGRVVESRFERIAGLGAALRAVERSPWRLGAAGEEGMKCGTEGEMLGDVAADEVGEELSEGIE